MKYLEYTRPLKEYYSQFWEVKESYRALRNRLINLEDHYVYILSPRIKRLNSVVSKKGYTTYIKKEIERTTRRLRVRRDSLRFINSKIRCYTKKFPLG